MKYKAAMLKRGEIQNNFFNMGTVGDCAYGMESHDRGIMDDSDEGNFLEIMSNIRQYHLSSSLSRFG